MRNKKTEERENERGSRNKDEEEGTDMAFVGDGTTIFRVSVFEKHRF